jgi:hypothetical protein
VFRPRLRRCRLRSSASEFRGAARRPRMGRSARRAGVARARFRRCSDFRTSGLLHRLLTSSSSARSSGRGSARTRR